MNGSKTALGISDLQRSLNVSFGKFLKALKLLALESPAPVMQDGNKWQATANTLSSEFWERIERPTAIRRREQEQMSAYAGTMECLMLFLSRALDDPGAQPLRPLRQLRGPPRHTRDLL